MKNYFYRTEPNRTEPKFNFYSLSFILVFLLILGCERDAIVDSTEVSHGNAKLSNIKIEPIKEDILLQNKKVWIS